MAAHTVHLGVHARPAYTYTNHVAVGANRTRPARLASLASKVGSRQKCCVSASAHTAAAPEMTLMLPSPGNIGVAQKTGVILAQCPDTQGITVALAQLLFHFQCNILQSDQFTDNSFTPTRLFQRIHFDYAAMATNNASIIALETALAQLAGQYEMEYKVSYRPQRKRMAILVSKMDHCLYDLLIRQRNNELQCDIPVIISNHPDLEHIADMFDIDFEHLGFIGGLDRETAKQQQEAAIEKVLDEACTDLIVLARYMQIFSEDFCNKNWTRTINIHRSFLPAFEGARPYHRAHERGVIGATAHYATAELDAGPIIEQDITRISHRDSVQDMVRKGRDLERLVLARAVRWHLNDRVLVTPTGRTVVFQD